MLLGKFFFARNFRLALDPADPSAMESRLGASKIRYKSADVAPTRCASRIFQVLILHLVAKSFILSARDRV